MDYSKVEVPQLYADAIEQAMSLNSVPLSKLRIKQIIDCLPATHKDNLAAQYAFRAYKAQHKRVNRLTALRDAAGEVLKTLSIESEEYNQLQSALSLFDDSTPSSEVE